ncbi:ATPase domain-containing protein [Oligoflexus tunisiensis]|uniref:ATPase domain-containing protein n=1 Tax=Oligoflexus tunisiensis TaxID=708132 RepID=UPI00114D2FAC|nr:ATPase domain-containing protein [Oligoflexus tunisiensis]
MGTIETEHHDEAGATNTTVLSTGIASLDLLLDGGITANALYLFEGMPGAGKTIMASQIAFSFAKRGKQVIYLSLIAESHGKLLQNIRKLDFFDEAMVGICLRYLSAYSNVMEKGLSGLLEILVNTVEKYAPSLIVIDGFRTARDIAATELDFTRFIHELNTFATTLNCTILLLSPSLSGSTRSEHTLVDGVIELTRSHTGMRSRREIEVHKFRGTNHLTGKHIFLITAQGIEIYPRVEARWNTFPEEPVIQNERLAFGIPQFDRMLLGGVPGNSTTALMGSPGAGKTLFGLYFLLEGIKNREVGLYFGFYETPSRLIRKAENLGLALGREVQKKNIHIMWRPPTEQYLDQLADQLIGSVEKFGAKRIFIDGMEGFRDSSTSPDRMPRFLTALTAKLRSMGTTTLYTEEMPLSSPEIRSSVTELSALVENVILFRCIEESGHLTRSLSIIKIRDSGFDHAVTRFTIADDGIKLLKSKGGSETDFARADLGSAKATSRPKQKKASAKKTKK